ARVLDGLGFRYYWVTQGLTEKDLLYKPNNDARTSRETIEHIYRLSKVIVNSTMKKPNMQTSENEDLSFDQIREITLRNIKTAADILRYSTDVSQYKVVFKSDNGSNEFPFWNQLNGPIADAIWHCGQIVLMRRSSGNPFTKNVSLFHGTIKNKS
ncbi:MAG: hypothetical protein KDC67_13145, partial [Ignavibacteriae bacterium]|nr:hypothetical protein [Ignavibacteriota bacterium]